MASSTSKSTSPTKKEQELQSDRQIKRILRDDGMKKPVIVYPPDDDKPNHYSLEIGDQHIGSGNAMIVDLATQSVYKLR